MTVYIIEEDELQRYENNCTAPLLIQGSNIRHRTLSENDKQIREQIVDELEFMIDEDLHFTDYSGKTMSITVERWQEIIKSLRSEG